MGAPPDPWVPDVLGPGFRARTVDLDPGSAPHSTATVVRYRPGDVPPVPGALTPSAGTKPSS